ncbi:MAG: ferritin-like domain-containing protein [Gammaproteobacteria bacterium]|nr:ferritin-like domain-containing protein [Gammaproteobacteria bacterium]
MTSGYHERQEDLTEQTLDLHRAIASLMEELEAVDWYQQRVDATVDPALREILAHNRDEEIEHASMVIEWLRRNHPKFDEQLRRFLFSSGPIAGAEAGEDDQGDGSLGLGKLAPARHAIQSRSTHAEKDPDDESSE